MEDKMKKLRLLTVLAITIAIFTSCASLMAHSTGMSQEDPGYRIVPKGFGENRAAAVFYGPEFLKAREDEKAKAEMREPRYASIHQFGYILIRIHASTAATANPKDWLFILQDGNGEEIYREYGENSIPTGEIYSTGSYYGSSWHDYHSIYLENEAVFPLSLRVVTPDKTPIDVVIEKK
jgi:hypothetical protein